VHVFFLTSHATIFPHSCNFIQVCDFGLSQVIPEGEELFNLQPRGTPLYMAPEVLAPGTYPLTGKAG
tara:strand:- start:83 stop:283 length:201 start_codon:yes stop_codon:yes gene_type:complete